MAHASLFVGNAGCHHGSNTGVDHFAHVNAAGCAGKVQGGQAEGRVLGDGYFIHLLAVAHGVADAAAGQQGQGRRGCKRTAAKAGGFGDGTVANVGAGIFLLEAWKKQALGQVRLGCEPLLAQAADAQTGFAAIARGSGDHRAEGYAVRCVHGGFAGHHGVVQKKLRCFGDEVQRLVDVILWRALVCAGQGGQGNRQRHEKQRRGCCIAAVYFVPHQQSLRLDGFEVYAAGFIGGVTHAGLEHWGEHRLKPFQALQHVRAIGAKAQAAADALVDVGVGQVAVGGVAHDDQGHGAADDAGHGPHRLEVMALGKLDFAVLQHVLSLLCGLRPAFVEQGADHCALHGPAHLGPSGGWASMQQQAGAFHLGPNAVSAQGNVFPHRPRLDDALGDLLVGRSNSGVAHEAGQVPGQGRISVAGGTPKQVVHAAAVLADAVVEAVNADVQHAGRLVQQGVVVRCHGESGAGSKFCRVSNTPASISPPEVAPRRSNVCTAA